VRTIEGVNGTLGGLPVNRRATSSIVRPRAGDAATDDGAFKADDSHVTFRYLTTMRDRYRLCLS